MASLQRVWVHGNAYWRIVESRRVNGKPRPIVVAYLGKPEDLLARLRAADQIEVRSRSHGAVAALYNLAQELDVSGSIVIWARRAAAFEKPRRRRRPVERLSGVTAFLLDSLFSSPQ
jgi:hypothetical protein